jgi:hypothetical protein
MTSYREEQYMSCVKALQFIFCKKNNQLDEYIVKVLMPEALLKICMRVYQCSKQSAEDFLMRDNKRNNFFNCPRDSIVKPEKKKKPAVITKARIQDIIELD